MKVIVTRFIEQALAPIHGARRRVLAAVGWAAMCGHVVSLSRLARGMVCAGGAAKAALKRVDRLVGHARIEREVDVVAEAILARLARWMDPLVIAVDWSAVTPGGTFVELRAAVVWSGMGCGLTLCQRVSGEAAGQRESGAVVFAGAVADDPMRYAVDRDQRCGFSHTVVS
ncbi:MAG: hypothetical protein ACKO32_01975 [Planctomycetia bacterium]